MEAARALAVVNHLGLGLLVVMIALGAANQRPVEVMASPTPPSSTSPMTFAMMPGSKAPPPPAEEEELPATAHPYPIVDWKEWWLRGAVEADEGIPPSQSAPAPRAPYAKKLRPHVASPVGPAEAEAETTPRCGPIRALLKLVFPRRIRCEVRHAVGK